MARVVPFGRANRNEANADLTRIAAFFAAFAESTRPVQVLPTGMTTTPVSNKPAR
jgi:hypothetical protein